MFQLIAFSVYALGFCFAICWLVWTFTNETILTLDAAKLTIQRRAMGIELFTESYPTMSVSDVTFIATMRSWTIRKNIDSRTGGIQFQAGSRAHTFASGIAEVEARALISRMLAVHKFPNNVESRDVRALN
jgi:hypothetical protein